MRKLERRAFICLTMAAILLAGLVIFVVRFVEDGGDWASFYGNPSIYTNGHLNRGAVYDRNDVLLVKNTKAGTKYNEDQAIRRATVQVVGDEKGNVSTSILNVYKDSLIGYNLLTGTYSFSEKSKDIKLTIDSRLSKIASDALGNRDGLVGVYNYETGEILTMVSHPDYDPMYLPNLNEEKSGMYMNKFLSATMTPGSIFKLITSAAAIETLPDLDSFRYTCTGVRIVGKDKIRCVSAHGNEDFESALANSCNGAFSQLADMIGPSTMKKYVKKCGLEKAYDIDGIKNAKGTFSFPNNEVNLGWAGIGQYKDLVNPCSMLIFTGAIANGGKSPMPTLVKGFLNLKSDTDRMIEESTAEELQRLMKNNVEKTYGTWRFPGLDMYAKSGTAEVGKDNHSNAWFTGFIKNKDKPYAFIVCVEKGGFGVDSAGMVASKVMTEAIKLD